MWCAFDALHALMQPDVSVGVYTGIDSILPSCLHHAATSHMVVWALFHHAQLWCVLTVPVDPAAVCSTQPVEPAHWIRIP